MSFSRLRSTCSSECIPEGVLVLAVGILLVHAFCLEVVHLHVSQHIHVDREPEHHADEVLRAAGN